MTGEIVTGTAVTLKRPALISVLAVLHFMAAFLWLLAGLVVLSLAPGSDSAAIAALAGILLAGVGTLHLACGIGLWRLRPYGRTLQLVFAWIGLLGIPIGTIISVLLLIYLFSPGVKILFSGKPAIDLTAEELTQVSGASESLPAVVAIVLLVAFVGIGGLGVVAAVAVPGLLRARMSANEASAIGSLRAINSAQAAFASSCGHGYYAPTLASLATPPDGRQDAFIHADLGTDPAINRGYTVVLSAGEVMENAPVACNGARVVSTYFASAEPLQAGTTGMRFFAVNQEGTLVESVSPIPPFHAGAPADAIPVR